MAWFLCVAIPLVLAAVTGLHSDTNANGVKEDRVSALLELQSRSPDGVIHLDDSSVHHFVTHQDALPRPYSLIVFFNALHLEDDARQRLDQLRREFGLLALTYISNNDGSDAASKVFFAHVDFKQSKRSFELFQVDGLPYIVHLKGGSTGPKDADAMDPSEFRGLAEDMASFVEVKTGYKVGRIRRPPRISKKQLVILIAGLIVAAPFVIKKLGAANSTLYSQKLWVALALFVYFFSVSGGMQNIVRRVPLFLRDSRDHNKLVFFYRGSRLQLGAEGYIVGFLYMVFGVMLAILTHLLVEVKNRTAQRMIFMVFTIIGVWLVREVILFDNWKTGYRIHGYWPNRWR